MAVHHYLRLVALDGSSSLLSNNGFLNALQFKAQERIVMLSKKNTIY